VRAEPPVDARAAAPGPMADNPPMASAHDGGQHDAGPGQRHDPGRGQGAVRAGHHGHTHDVSGTGHRTFAVAIALNAGFVLLEAAAGWYAGALSLLSDAGHNLGDVLALGLAWAGTWAARQPGTDRFTWGWRRAAVLAALVNAALLLAALGAIAWEAIGRLREPTPVDATVVVGVAAAGIVINGLTALLFAGGHRRDLNRRAAFLHMLADAAVSAGVVAGGLLVAATGWWRLDPAIGLGIAALVAVSTLALLRQSLALALDAVPAGIDLAGVRAHLLAQPGVSSLHDLHVWPMGSAGAALSVHLVMPAGAPGDAFLADLRTSLHDAFDIDHVTVQIESGDPAHRCAQDCAPAGPAPGAAATGQAGVAASSRSSRSRTGRI